MGAAVTDISAIPRQRYSRCSTREPMMPAMSQVLGSDMAVTHAGDKDSTEPHFITDSNNNKKTEREDDEKPPALVLTISQEYPRMKRMIVGDPSSCSVL